MVALELIEGADLLEREAQPVGTEEEGTASAIDRAHTGNAVLAADVKASGTIRGNEELISWSHAGKAMYIQNGSVRES
jgi:hypothetical protein